MLTCFMIQVIFWYKSLLWRNDFDVNLFHDTGRFFYTSRCCDITVRLNPTCFMIQVNFWYESAFNGKPTCCVLILNQWQIVRKGVRASGLVIEQTVLTLFRKILCRWMEGALLFLFTRWLYDRQPATCQAIATWPATRNHVPLTTFCGPACTLGSRAICWRDA